MQQKDKYKKGEFGFMPLSKVVNQFMNDSFNNGRKYYSNMLSIARYTYKKLHYKELGLAKKMVVHIDPSTRTAEIPPSYMIGVGFEIVDDCNKLHRLSPDEDFNELVIPEAPSKKGCGCKKCNCNSEVCGAANAVEYIEENVIIDLVSYPKITRRRLMPTGDIYEEITESLPKGDSQGNVEIIERFTRKFIAKVEVLPCGCVIDKPYNNNECIIACGCHHRCCNEDRQKGHQHNKYGYYKIDAKRGIIHFRNVKQKFAIFTFQSDGEGEDNEEIMVPEYFVDTLMAGMFHRSLRFRLNVPGSRARDAKREYKEELQDLIELLNPIDYEEVKRIQEDFMKW